MQLQTSKFFLEKRTTKRSKKIAKRIAKKELKILAKKE